MDHNRPNTNLKQDPHHSVGSSNGRSAFEDDPYLELGIPHAREAENAIMGAIMLDDSVIAEARSYGVIPELFFQKSVRYVFEQALALDARGMPIDIVTLSDALRDANQFEYVGGAAFIFSLIDGVPRGNAIGGYVKSLKDAYWRRRIITLTESLHVRSADRDDAESIGSVVREIARAQEELRVVFDPEANRSPLVHASELQTLPVAEHIIARLIIKNKLSLIFGPAGAGKSFVALDIGLSVAQFATVIYVAAEDPDDLKLRVEAWSKHHKRDAGNFYLFMDPVYLLDPVSVDNFVRCIGERGLSPVVIIYDPLTNCMAGGDDSSTADMTIARDALYKIGKATGGPAQLVIHHSGWDDKHERGSTALRGAARVVGKLENIDGLIALRPEKDNVGQFPPRFFKLLQIADSMVVHPSDEVADETEPLTARQQEILKYIADPLNDMGVTFKEVIDSTNVGKSTASRGLNALSARGLIIKNRNKFHVTPNGREVSREPVRREHNPVDPAFKKAVELGLNWPVKFALSDSEMNGTRGGVGSTASPEQSPFGSDAGSFDFTSGSAQVPSRFHDGGSMVPSVPPPLGGGPVELERLEPRNPRNQERREKRRV